MRKNQVECGCDYCGKHMSKQYSKYQRTKNHFCSFECRAKFSGEQDKKSRQAYKCDYCGKEFYVPKWRFEGAKRHFCNLACHIAWQKRHQHRLNCEFCGEEFIKHNSLWERDNHHFCSMLCRNKWEAENRKGKSSHMWEGGIHIAKDGYVFVYMPGYSKNKGNYVLEHRLVMEKHLGRQLKKTEVVHHLNGIRDDNRIENLAVVTRPTHENRTLQKLQTERIRELEKQLEVMKNKSFENNRIVGTGKRGFIQDPFSENDRIYSTYPHTQTSGLPIFKA